jgi:hypothetical protein
VTEVYVERREQREDRDAIAASNDVIKVTDAPFTSIRSISGCGMPRLSTTSLTDG